MEEYEELEDRADRLRFGDEVFVEKTQTWARVSDVHSRGSRRISRDSEDYTLAVVEIWFDGRGGQPDWRPWPHQKVRFRRPPRRFGRVPANWQ